jgi:hypothetical protein
MLLTKPVTRINGRPEIEDIDTLEKEVARIAALPRHLSSNKAEDRATSQ